MRFIGKLIDNFHLFACRGLIKCHFKLHTWVLMEIVIHRKKKYEVVIHGKKKFGKNRIILYCKLLNNY